MSHESLSDKDKELKQRSLVDDLNESRPPPQDYQDRYEEFNDQYQIVYGVLLLILSVGALLLAIVSTTFWLSKSQYSEVISRRLNILNCVVSIVSIRFLFGIYHLEFTLFKYVKLPNASPWRFITYDYTWVKFIFECIIHCLFPYPWLEKESYWLSFCVMIRLYRVPDVIRRLSYIYRMRNRIKPYMRFYNQDLPKYTSGFIIKTILNTHGFKFFAVFCILLYVILCYLSFSAVKNSSLSYPPNSDFLEGSLSSTLYWTFQTGTALGYGEMSLDLTNGYVLFISVVVAFIGLLNNSLLTGIFALELSSKRIEENAIEMCRGLELKDTLEETSKEFLREALGYKQSLESHRNTEKKRQAVLIRKDEIYKQKWQLKDIFQNFRNLEVSVGVRELHNKWKKSTKEHQENQKLAESIEKLSVMLMSRYRGSRKEE